MKQRKGQTSAAPAAKSKAPKGEPFSYQPLIVPGIVTAVGFLLVVICAPMTTYVNKAVQLGFLVLTLGFCMLVFSYFREQDYCSYKPSLKALQLQQFRNAYNAFFAKDGITENSSLQSHTTQLLWHVLYLQKRRMDRHAISMELDGERKRIRPKILADSRAFDGRFQLEEISEQLMAERRYLKNGKVLFRYRCKEAARYTRLSARRVGENQIICPNCGSSTTRDNLMDGCDYCGTRFTVEDLRDRVSAFGLRPDFYAREQKREVVTEMISPTVMTVMMLLPGLFGFIGAFVYMTENIFMRLIAGLVATALLSLLGWCMAQFGNFVVVPVVAAISILWERANNALRVADRRREAADRKMAEQVRAGDPNFSIQSFYSNISNKLASVIFAENAEQINDFSEQDLSALLPRYADVMDMDVRAMQLTRYGCGDGWQWAEVQAELRLLHDYGTRLKPKTERVTLTLQKSAACKTQAVGTAAAMKCPGCGASLSLLEGKTCRYCGRRLDFKQHDWVIYQYQIN